MKGRIMKITGFQTLRHMGNFLLPKHKMFFYPTLQSLWDWLILICPLVIHHNCTAIMSLSALH